MRVFVILALIVGALWIVSTSTPPKPTETNGERWARMCAVEAGSDVQSQKDCMFRHSLEYVYTKHAEDYRRRLRDAELER